jgi:hypothetical protein
MEKSPLSQNKWGPIFPYLHTLLEHLCFSMAPMTFPIPPHKRGPFTP